RPDDSPGSCVCVVPSKHPCHAKVRYLGVHILVKKDVASFQIPVNDSESRITVE
ncbi:unnamed protein product, partial [Musa banksii]